VFVDDSANDVLVEQAKDWFESRKWFTNGLALSDTREDITSKTAAASFLRFFLAQPIGPRILTFDRSRRYFSYVHRATAVDQAYLTWFALNYAARRADGRFKHAIPCAGYLRDVRGTCYSSVLDASGFCPSHRKPKARTLFTFYPWFEEEGFPEFSDVVQSTDVLTDHAPTEAERNRKREQVARSAAIKLRLTEVLLQGKAGDTLTRLQLSNIIDMAVSPGEPGYRIVQSAIRNCGKVFVFWSWSKVRGKYECTYADKDAKTLLKLTESSDEQHSQLQTLMFDRWTVEIGRRTNDLAVQCRRLALDAQCSALPESLRTSEFLDAWVDWMTYYLDVCEGRMTSSVYRESVAKLESWGPERGVAAIRHSMAHRAHGIYEPK
jgi:hypothetical protein